MRPLDPFQLELAETSLIEASAGTGKTYALTTLYLRLLVEFDLAPSQILVVTFTQAATAELRTRVRERVQQALATLEQAAAVEASDDEEAKRLLDLARHAQRNARERGGVDALRRALRDFDEAAIFTIHGFCQRTLLEQAFESGVAFDPELVEDSAELDRTLAHDLWDRLVAEEPDDFVEWLMDAGASRWQFTPDALARELLGLLGADEDMPIRPHESHPAESHASLREGAEQLAQAWRRWSRVWRRRRERVAALLLGEHDLKRNVYAAERIEGLWLPELESLADRIEQTPEVERAALARVRVPVAIERLTPQGLAEGLKRSGRPLSDPFFEACADVVEAASALDRARDARALALRRRFVEAARAEAARRREERHVYLFDDLLSETRRALRRSPGGRLARTLRERYPFALIDEFQDTDAVQYEIFRRVWHGSDGESPGGLVLVGDPKQAIYAFRDADVETYLSARADAGDRGLGLTVNWRSDPRVVRATNALFARPRDAFGQAGIEFHPVQPRPGASDALASDERSTGGLRVLLAEREQVPADQLEPSAKALPLRFGRTHLMDAVARDIADLLDSDARIDGRPLRPSDIAILARRNVELQAARRALERMGLPCVDRGPGDVFDSREAWELLCVLEAMRRPADAERLRAALATGAHGLDATSLAALSEDAVELTQAGDRYAEYGRLWTQRGIGPTLETWRREQGVTARLLGFEDGERRVTNTLHLVELLQRVEREHHRSRASLTTWLARAIASPEVRTGLGGDASLLRLERDDDAISLVTLHSSKGLEYEIVYLPSLWEIASSRADASLTSALDERGRRRPVRYHDPDAGRRVLDLGSEDYARSVERARDEARAEQLRLLYVGLTRAKRQTVVAWGRIGTAYRDTPLARLLCAPLAGASEAGTGRTRASAPLESVAGGAGLPAPKDWTDEDWRQAWEALADAAGRDAISIERPDFTPRARWRSRVLAADAMAFAPAERVLSRGRRTTSFSALVRESSSPLAPSTGPAWLGQDHDAATGLGDAPARGLGLDAVASEVAPTDLAGGMDAFPRGARAGTLLHEVLERVDLRARDAASIRESARSALRRNGLPETYQDEVVHVVEAVATTSLPNAGGSLRLETVAPGAFVPELEFTLAADASRTGLSGRALAALLRERRAGSTLARYADRAASLDFAEVDGFLRGFIDAVFRVEDRYYLIDYKSNHLGSRVADYANECLIDAMIAHDYVLQYLIYALALDRHLARRLADYDYDRDFGGVYYLFVRGLAPTHPPGTGVFFDRPPRALIEALSGLLGGAEGPATSASMRSTSDVVAAPGVLS